MGVQSAVYCYDLMLLLMLLLHACLCSCIEVVDAQERELALKLERNGVSPMLVMWEAEKFKGGSLNLELKYGFGTHDL